MSETITKIAERQKPCGRCDGSGFIRTVRAGYASGSHCLDCQGRGWVMPQRWEVPTEPGSSVQAVRDSLGDLWRRESGGWRYQKRMGALWSWATLLRQLGPLIDATNEIADSAQRGAEGAPITEKERADG